MIAVDAECCFQFLAKFSSLVVCHLSITDSLFLDIGIENKLSAESSVLWKKRSEHFTRFTFHYEWRIMLAQKMWEILFIMSCSYNFFCLASSGEVFVPSLRWYLYPLQSVRTLDLMFLSGTCLNQGKSAHAGNKGVKTWIINIISRYPKTNNWPWIYKHQGQFMICQ